MVLALMIAIGIMALAFCILKFAFGVAFSLIGFVFKFMLPCIIILAVIGALFLYVI